MEDKNYKYWADAVADTIQDAIRTGDFGKVSRNVSDSVDNMLRAFGIPTDEEERRQNASRNASRNQYNAQGRSSSGPANPYSGTAEQSRRFQEQYNRHAAAQPRRSSSGNGANYYSAPKQTSSPRVKTAARRESDKYYMSKDGTKKNGLLMTIAGYAVALVSFSVFALTTIVSTISQVIQNTGGGLNAGGLVMLGITAISAFAGTKGLQRLRLSSRFQRYRNIIGDDTSIKISRLALETGRSEKEVVEDLEKMIELGWFVQGHLDEEKTYLITSEEMYRLYLEKRLQSMELKREAEEKKNQQDSIPEDVREIIHTGAQYIKEIHACNDAIPGEEISKKISKMETIIQQIFLRTEQHPEVAGELRKTMNYYLPTTVKLLRAYQDLDSQPIAGENIANSKREIEETLDTLNNAYEKLLDGLFKETAWDVSTDISVIKTLLAQEGLAESDFVMPTATNGKTATATATGYAAATASQTATTSSTASATQEEKAE